MVRKLFLTPPSWPEGSVKRCLVIPDSKEWLGIFNDALLATINAWAYEQVNETDLTPEEVAAYCYAIYEQWLRGECGIVDVRQSLINPCTLEKTYDGVVWEPFASLLLCEAATGVVAEAFAPTGDYQVVDGELQWSGDGGVTWTDVPGFEAGVAEATTLAAQERCLGSANAVNVISEFYRQTVGAFTAGAMNVLLDVNAFLQAVNQVLINIVFPDWKNSMFGAWVFQQQDFSTHYAAPALDQTAQDALLCLLYDNAINDGNGVTRFDYQAVVDNVISVLGVNPGTAVYGLLQYMQAAGLDAAGSTTAIAVADCTDCEPLVDCESYLDSLALGLGPKTAIVDWTGYPAWQTIDGLPNSDVQFYPEWIASGGRSNGDGCIRTGRAFYVNNYYDTVQVLIDLGRECSVSFVRFYARTVSGTGTGTRQLRMYNALQQNVYSFTLANATFGTGWQASQWSFSPITARYIEMSFRLNGNIRGLIDDLQVTVV